MKNILLILFIAIAVVPQSTSAQYVSADNVVVDEAVDRDLYIAGGTVTINAPVRGDLIVAGGTIIVNDSVGQDILVAGGNISLNGVVADDIRCAGGRIQLSGSVLGDFVVTGGQIEIGENATVSGNLLSSGGEVTLNGNVMENIRNASGNFTLNGVAEQDLETKGGSILINGEVHGQTIMAAEVIELGPDALFKNDVRYWNKTGSLDFKNSLQGGEAKYDSGLAIENGKWQYLGFASIIVLLWYLGTALVMSFLIQYLFTMTLSNAANTIKNATLKSLGLGFLFLIGVPIAVVLLFVSLIGIPVGILVFITYLTIILFATVIVSLLISNWINNSYYQSSWRNGRISIVAFGIFIFLKIASLTPVVGALVMLLLAAMAFGGILLNVKWRRNSSLALT